MKCHNCGLESTSPDSDLVMVNDVPFCWDCITPEQAYKIAGLPPQDFRPIWIRQGYDSLADYYLGSIIVNQVRLLLTEWFEREHDLDNSDQYNVQIIQKLIVEVIAELENMATCYPELFRRGVAHLFDLSINATHETFVICDQYFHIRRTGQSSGWIIFRNEVA